MEPQQGVAAVGGEPAARPLVNPDEYGEVDTTRYPAPKDATNKVRGRSDLLEMICGAGTVDPELLTVKTFYFFFYSAFGSLFPLMGVYFKQMGMNAGQCGLLIGTRPFVEFLSAPFWGGLADRWQKGRTLLLASLGAWIIFTLPLSWVQPGAVACVQPVNSSTYLLVPPSYDEDAQPLGRGFHGPSPRREGSPLPVSDAQNYNPDTNSNWVTPLHSFIVYSTPNIQKTFFLLLLLVVIGEFFSAPAITLADSAVITLLGEDADRYGHQRMFGSLGWGLAMFFVGIALDHSTAFSSHPCGGPQRYEKNYTICFATFSVLMGAALVTATQIRFKYEAMGIESERGTEEILAPEPTQEERLQEQLAAQLQLPGLDTRAPAAAPAPQLQHAKVFAQTTREMPEWVTVLKQFQNVKAASFLLVAWFMGFGIGLIFTFLFWHLQDIGGSPTLFGVASVINHISEIFAYFFSFKLITQMGHVKVLCLGLAGNVVRFLYISWLTDPWWVLPFEFVQGVTHAAVWAACCSYIAHGAPARLRSSAQGVLQGLHHGLGRGCGAVIGGIAVAKWGTTRTFAGYGILCAVALAAFAFVNFRDGGASEVIGGDSAAEEEARAVAEAGVLAPHGVPSNPLPRALSSTRLSDLGHHDNYGATQNYSGAESLSVPGAAPTAQPTNPFATDQLQQRQPQPTIRNTPKCLFCCDEGDEATDTSAISDKILIRNEKTVKRVCCDKLAKISTNNSVLWTPGTTVCHDGMACCTFLAPTLLLHVNLLLVVFAGGALVMAARARWDPTLYAPARELFPNEYRAAAVLLPVLAFTTIIAAHTTLIALRTRHLTLRRALLYAYACVVMCICAAQTAGALWAYVRGREWARTDHALEIRNAAALADQLQPLLQQLAHWHPLPQRLADILKEAREDLPHNLHALIGASSVVISLQLFAVLLAVLSAVRTPIAPSRAKRSYMNLSTATAITPLSSRKRDLSSGGRARAVYKNGKLMLVEPLIEDA
ncbi:unnamed protein product [Leptosia nina]|uniref:Major facilitator superfamily associated domain-containing protein n=1 Tax=Leptosia nina TaxID=320188 RepID=A0AAV1J010_9NEOP